MTSKELMNDFTSQKTLAIIGVSSRDARKFGNMAFRELTAKGYELIPIHPGAEILEDVQAYKNLASLPKKVDGLVLVVHPEETEKVVREAAAVGIKRIWMQPGSESETAIAYCKENGISVIHGECIMMYAVGTGLHGFHAWVWKLLGKSPK